MVRGAISAVKQKESGRAAFFLNVVAVFRLGLIAFWPAVFVLTDDTRIHHSYILISGNVASFIHSAFNDCLLAHTAIAGAFLLSLVARPPYRVWGIGSIAYSAIIFFAHACGPRLPRWDSVYNLVRVRQKPA
jgi:hypothetical protein